MGSIFGQYDSTPKHKCFISFHQEDASYRAYLEDSLAEQFGAFVNRSVQEGDIDESLSTERTFQIIRDDFIADATVTVVLVGPGTWRRKYVDWEIGSSLRNTKNNPRTGLIGILLPSYSASWFNDLRVKNCENGGIYHPHTIPPRLWDNIESGYAKIYSWPGSANELKAWIHEAFEGRDETPVNCNRSINPI